VEEERHKDSRDRLKAQVLKQIKEKRDPAARGVLSYEELLERVCSYISNEAPRIIWFPPFKQLTEEGKPTLIRKMIADVAFRNLHEVLHGSGSKDVASRVYWEANLFNRVYDGMPPHDRPKYGLFNMLNDPRALRPAGISTAIAT